MGVHRAEMMLFSWVSQLLRWREGMKLCQAHPWPCYLPLLTNRFFSLTGLGGIYTWKGLLHQAGTSHLPLTTCLFS